MNEINVGKVAMVPIANIEVEDRYRQEMGDLSSLEESMKTVAGLIAPLAVRDIGGGKFRLLAGERRYMVLLSNQIQQVPVRIYEEDLSPLDMMIIEKAENFYRKDMEPQEYDKLVYDMHTLQQERYGVPSPGVPGHSMEDTGEMFGMTKASVSMAVKRHEAREAFPELFVNCKTQKDATKVIKKMDEAIVKKTIAEKLEREKAEGTTLKKLANAFILGDFFEGVKKIPDGVIHLVEIDPPYAIDLTKQKKKDGESQYQLDDYNEIDNDYYGDFLIRTFKQCYRVMADHSWMIVWFAPEPWFNTVHALIKDAGFQTTRMCGIWTKGTSGQNMNPTIRLSNSYEMFFYAWKGSPGLNKAGRSNEFHYPPVPPQQKTHPTERPVELMRDIYDTFAFPGSRVLVPFLGSGSGLIAAYNLGLSAMGFELSKGYRDSFLVKVHGMG